jgi:hypothetical protein
MNRLWVLAIASVALSGCFNTEPKTYRTMDVNGTQMQFEAINYEGHRFVQFYRAGQPGAMIHDLNCSACKDMRDMSIWMNKKGEQKAEMPKKTVDNNNLAL